MGSPRRRAPRHDSSRLQMGEDRQEAGAHTLYITPRPQRSLTAPPQQFSDDEGEADQPLAPIQPEDLVEYWKSSRVTTTIKTKQLGLMPPR